jgi:hypothetical protein
MSKLSIAALFVALLLFGTAFAGDSLTPHRAEYKVKISVVSGRLNTELRQTEDGYVAHHVIKPTGFSKLLTRGRMDVTSEFSTAVDGVKPVRFQAIDTIRDDPDVNLSFDWSSNEVSGTVGSDDVTMQLEGLAHDSVSIQYELMSDLISGVTDDQYTLFDIDKMRVTEVSEAGSKRIKTKAGVFDAIGVRHQKQGSSRITTLWCVEELNFLPVIIEQHRKGKVIFKATLVKYTPTGEAST